MRVAFTMMGKGIGNTRPINNSVDPPAHCTIHTTDLGKTRIRTNHCNVASYNTFMPLLLRQACCMDNECQLRSSQARMHAHTYAARTAITKIYNWQASSGAKLPMTTPTQFPRQAHITTAYGNAKHTAPYVTLPIPQQQRRAAEQ